MNSTEEEERLELDRALAGERYRLERRLPVVRKVLVELVVLVLLDVLLRALPQRDHRVEGLGLALLAALAVVVLLVLRRIDLTEGYRIRDEVGVLLDEIVDAPPVEVLLLVVPEMKRD